VILDWQDASNYVVVRPRVGYATWTIERTSDGTTKQLFHAVADTNLRGSIVVRRSKDRVRVDLPRGVNLNVTLGPPDENSKIGLADFGATPQVLQFSVGPWAEQ
jgi:hypothetical protein